MDKEHSALGKETPPRPSIGSPRNEKPDEISQKVNGRKSIIPEVLQVSKAFKFPNSGRYLSPTDLIISPVSKRLLARNQKVTTLSKQAENPFMESGLFGT